MSRLSLLGFLCSFSSVSICFFRDEWRPDSFYDKIKTNMQNQFHTLCLLGQKRKRARAARAAPQPAPQCGRFASAKPSGSIGRLVGGPPLTAFFFLLHAALHLSTLFPCPQTSRSRSRASRTWPSELDIALAMRVLYRLMLKSGGRTMMETRMVRAKAGIHSLNRLRCRTCTGSVIVCIRAAVLKFSE